MKKLKREKGKRENNKKGRKNKKDESAFSIPVQKLGPVG